VPPRRVWGESRTWPGCRCRRRLVSELLGGAGGAAAVCAAGILPDR
jgi:hypothetical protein